MNTVKICKNCNQEFIPENSIWPDCSYECYHERKYGKGLGSKIKIKLKGLRRRFLKVYDDDPNEAQVIKEMVDELEHLGGDHL